MANWSSSLGSSTGGVIVLCSWARNFFSQSIQVVACKQTLLFGFCASSEGASYEPAKRKESFRPILLLVRNLRFAQIPNKRFCLQTKSIRGSGHASKWPQTSLIFLFFCSRFITIILRQRKINIKLVWNHFNLKSFLTTTQGCNHTLKQRKIKFKLFGKI